jgi:pilus assembly protein CpaC
MTKRTNFSRGLVGTALAALIAGGLASAGSAPAAAQVTSAKPTEDVAISVGAGRMVRLDSNMSDLFIANPGVADVQVRSANQLYIFGKAAGETTVYATNSAGRVVYSATVRVGNNIDSIGEMLGLAMPQSQIQVTPMNGVVLLTGTVADPADVEDATRLVQGFVGDGTQVVTRLKTATPLQVMLQVKIAEVSRSLTRDIGVNLMNRDTSGGSTGFVFNRGRTVGEFNETGGVTFASPSGISSAGVRLSDFLGSGLDIAAALDLHEESGLVTTLAEPTLVALSGETASFLAGGEFPIPTAQGINGTSVEFKEYGVSLAFTPTVLEGGRISMRVRPEVSEISALNAVRMNGFEIPSLTTRRTETTVELGSGQSFMISGLLSNNNNNTVEKTPFLGSLPILGALFRSNGFRRNQTELVIVVTPYLVKPVNASQIALPTDGFRSANDGQRLLLDKQHDSRSRETRPVPRMIPPRTVAPGLTTGGVAQTPAAQPAPSAQAAKPGFGF